MASTGNPTPAKPKAGETMIPVRLSPTAMLRASNCIRQPII